jgi:hypothetical protein
VTTATRGSSGEIAVAIQTAEGSAAGTAAFAHPLISGLPKPVETTSENEVTELSTELVPGWHKTEQHWEMDTTFWASPRATGTWIKSIIPALSTAGGSDPYTHTFTTGGTAVPGFITVFATGPGSRYAKFSDGTTQELNFQFEAGQPLKLNVKAMGYTPSDLAADYDATVTETLPTSGSWFSMIGGTFKIDNDSTPASTTVATVKSGTINVTRDLELIQTDGLAPEHRSLGVFRVGVALELLFTNYQLFKSTYYGGTAGTTASAAMVAGSLDFTFAQGPTSSANRTLQVQIPNVFLRVPDPPDVDPSGGHVSTSVVGVTAKPSSGDIITAVLKSSDTTY